METKKSSKGLTRREKKARTLKNELQEWLNLELGDDELHFDEICLAIIEQAAKGNVRAYEAIKNTVEDKNINLNVNITIQKTKGE